MIRKVLMVEDIELCAATLEIALLKIPELIVKSATSAEEALHMISDGDGDISALITDIHLPKMDGFQFIQQIRSEPRFRHLPILVISGDSDPHTAGRLRTLGADAYFPKPYSPAEVRKRLEELIDQ
ncbi:MAG: response regulator [Acidobacteriota bacterium]|nr:response regulator [Acidobacteriota bacterium]